MKKSEVDDLEVNVNRCKDLSIKFKDYAIRALKESFLIQRFNSQFYLRDLLIKRANHYPLNVFNTQCRH